MIKEQLGDRIKKYEDVFRQKLPENKTIEYDVFSRGPRKGQKKPETERCVIKINNRIFDWYEIVDLRNWINK